MPEPEVASALESLPPLPTRGGHVNVPMPEPDAIAAPSPAPDAETAPSAEPTPAPVVTEPEKFNPTLPEFGPQL